MDAKVAGGNDNKALTLSDSVNDCVGTSFMPVSVACRLEPGLFNCVKISTTSNFHDVTDLNFRQSSSIPIVGLGEVSDDGLATLGFCDVRRRFELRDENHSGGEHVQHIPGPAPVFKCEDEVVTLKAFKMENSSTSCRSRGKLYLIQRADASAGASGCSADVPRARAILEVDRIIAGKHFTSLRNLAWGVPAPSRFVYLPILIFGLSQNISSSKSPRNTSRCCHSRRKSA